MPVLVEASGGLPLWTKQQPSLDYGAGLRPIRIALLNNMPDAALEDTELQFFDLLDAASGEMQVAVKLYSLAGVRRTEHGIRRLNSFYYSLDDLWNSQFDALIMTGTEPQRPSLRQEPYWRNLTTVLDWAERNTVSTILSCLAAHAGVLHSDGIDRSRLNDKRFGVFEFPAAAGDSLTRGLGTKVRFPHSRWNEVLPAGLESCGYTILTRSEEAGVDCFTKSKSRSLFVHFQGHPEYQARTLFKEYRRDIRRYLRQERDTYPAVPVGYFADEAAERLKGFEQQAMRARNEDVMTEFPETFLTRSLHNGWRSSAVRIYRNWLELISEKKDAFSHASIAVPRSEDMLQWAE